MRRQNRASSDLQTQPHPRRFSSPPKTMWSSCFPAGSVMRRLSLKGASGRGVVHSLRVGKMQSSRHAPAAEDAARFQPPGGCAARGRLIEAQRFAAMGRGLPPASVTSTAPAARSQSDLLPRISAASQSPGGDKRKAQQASNSVLAARSSFPARRSARHAGRSLPQPRSGARLRHRARDVTLDRR